jgi:hypothetical protein
MRRHFASRARVLRKAVGRNRFSQELCGVIPAVVHQDEQCLGGELAFLSRLAQGIDAQGAIEDVAVVGTGHSYSSSSISA